MKDVDGLVQVSQQLAKLKRYQRPGWITLNVPEQLMLDLDEALTMITRTKSEFVCATCGIAVSMLANGNWRHQASGRTGPSCKMTPKVIRRDEYKKETRPQASEAQQTPHSTQVHEGDVPTSYTYDNE